METGVWNLVLVVMVTWCCVCVGQEAEVTTEAHPVRVADEESLRYSVTLSIYPPVPKKQFEAEIETYLQDSIIDVANTHCESRPSRCSMQTWRERSEFDADHVLSLTSDPAKLDTFLIVKLSMQLPAGADVKDDAPSLRYLNRKALQDIVVGSREGFRETSGGYHIIQVNEENLGLPPNKTLNIIMIIVAAVILFSLLLVYALLRKFCALPPEPVGEDDESDDEEPEKATLNPGKTKNETNTV